MNTYIPKLRAMWMPSTTHTTNNNGDADDRNDGKYIYYDKHFF